MQYGKVSMTMKRVNHITKQDEAKHDKKPQELEEGQVDILPNWDMLHLGCYNVLLYSYELNTLDAGRSRSMCGVIVVDAELFRSTCRGRDAYIHDHAYIFS